MFQSFHSISASHSIAFHQGELYLSPLRVFKKTSPLGESLTFSQLLFFHLHSLISLSEVTFEVRIGFCLMPKKWSWWNMVKYDKFVINDGIVSDFGLEATSMKFKFDCFEWISLNICICHNSRRWNLKRDIFEHFWPARVDRSTTECSWKMLKKGLVLECGDPSYHWLWSHLAEKRRRLEWLKGAEFFFGFACSKMIFFRPFCYAKHTFFARDTAISLWVKCLDFFFSTHRGTRTCLVFFFGCPEFDLEALKSSHHHVGCTVPHIATW